MNTRLSLFFTFLCGVALFAAGCSSSEETAKQDGTSTSGEFQRTDKEQAVIPSTDTPPSSRKDDIPSTERNTPTRTTEREAATETVITKQPELSRQPDPTKTGALMWSVQIGAFKAEAGANSLLNEAKAKMNQPVYKDYDPVSGLYKVTIGSFQTREQATQFKEEVIGKGYSGAFSVEVRR